jgi:hypothetical protein
MRTDCHRRNALGLSTLRAALPLALCLLAPCAGAAEPERVAWIWDGARQPRWPGAGAALLQRHILLTGDRVLTRPRMHSAALSAGTPVTPVVHVDLSIVHPPQDVAAGRAAILRAVTQAAAHSSSGWVQLDMEAMPSQRQFYKALVRELRAALPPDVKLSVTALAWWCRAPAWLDDLAADEVVPMFFRMGQDSASLRAVVSAEPALLHPRCRAASAGFSPQEPFAPSVTGRYQRSYWFDYHAWKSMPATHATGTP